jgi:hypothetical protein
VAKRRGDEDEGPAFTISRHARERMRQRGIRVSQVAEAMARPDRTVADREDPGIRHAIRRFGRRVLGVVYNFTVRPPRVVTAFFDRRLGRSQRR